MPNILMTLMVVLHTWVVLQRQNCVLRCFLPRFVAKHREPYNTYKGDNHESVDTHHYTTKITSRSNSPGFPCTKRRACCRLPGLKTTRLRKSNSSQEKILTQIWERKYTFSTDSLWSKASRCPSWLGSRRGPSEGLEFRIHIGGGSLRRKDYFFSHCLSWWWW